MPFVEVDKKAFFVTLGDYVTTEDSTGIVHTAQLLVKTTI